MAKLIGGPADGRYVRVYNDTDIYRVAVQVWSKPAFLRGDTEDFGYLVAKYRYSGLSRTEIDGSIPVMLYGFIRLEK